ncbi:MAG: 16S rRNA (guanine(966)-N(2))-methyltransferase RsmD [Lachnospiraceae bacterium]|nr:16S rRNA (guanine(966)-N(2))-methyltransferase RsmD [Lachnospiraceae bacterium]
MRVIAGSCKSLPLKTITGNDTRPTTDRIKETLFNMLQSHIMGSVFVDLFSGSGAIGIEALSRGAKKTYFVEQSRDALQCIRDNLSFTGLQENAVVMAEDARNIWRRFPEDQKIDMIFMDPPYEKGLEKEVLSILRSCPCIDDETLIIVEASLQTDFSYLEEWGYHVIKEKKYKTNKHLFLSYRMENRL